MCCGQKRSAGRARYRPRPAADPGAIAGQGRQAAAAGEGGTVGANVAQQQSAGPAQVVRFAHMRERGR
jgi:hypothetical protein